MSIADFSLSSQQTGLPPGTGNELFLFPQRQFDIPFLSLFFQEGNGQRSLSFDIRLRTGTARYHELHNGCKVIPAQKNIAGI